MDPEKNIDEVVDTFDEGGGEVSVDDFIRQLEEKEKDLHITAETSIIEIAEGFEDDEIPEFLKDALEPKPAGGSFTVAPAGTNNTAEVKKLESELGKLKATISKMESDRDEMFKNSQRRTKDFEALKARAERERKETFQNQISNVAMLMLPALDNLHRALDSVDHLTDEKSDAFQQFHQGIALVSEQINEILNKMGIKPIRTIGEEFDPHYHEAVATEETSEYPPNYVCGEMLRGYIAGERVIRHSMVKVAVAPAGQTQDPFDNDDDLPEEAHPSSDPANE